MKVKAILKSGYFADSRHATNYIAYLDKQNPIFDQNGKEVNVLDAQVEVENPDNSTVWHHIYSLNDSDCERLDVDRDYMKNLVMLKASEIAKAYNISPQNLRMICSWHNKDFHPHLHFLIYSTDSREAFIPHPQKKDSAEKLNKATRALKSCLTNEIFKGDLEHLKIEKSAQRDKLNAQLRLMVSSEYLIDKEMISELKALGKEIHAAQGKHTYKLLSPDLKAQVDTMLEKIIRQDPTLNTVYMDYLDSQKELVRTYAANEETLDKKFAALENSFFHPYCDLGERSIGRAEVTRHNILIHAAERLASAVQKEKNFEYREKSPTYLVQNMMFRLAKTLQTDSQQAYIQNRAVQAANGLLKEKQNIRKIKTSVAEDENLSALEY